MDNQELKPCPFCGNTKAVFRPGDAPKTQVIMCLDCDITVGEYYTRAELIEAWNRRPDPWTHINPADPATFPPGDEYPILFCYRIDDPVRGQLLSVRDGLAFVVGNQVTFADYEGDHEFDNVYAWQPWPDPPPYPAPADEFTKEG